jgi:hypothetical protein
VRIFVCVSMVGVSCVFDGKTLAVARVLKIQMLFLRGSP